MQSTVQKLFVNENRNDVTNKMALPENVSNYLGGLTFVAFDTETTGIWAASNRLVEIAAVKFSIGSDTAETFSELINPRREIPDEVIRIHGITNEMVASADTASGVLKRFVDFCGSDSVLIAHNAPFDISHVGCELDRYSIPFGDNMILDTVEIFRRYYPGLSSYSLLSLAQILKVAEKQSHRALADSEIVRDIFMLAVERFPRVDSEDRLRVSFKVSKMSDWQPSEITLPGEYADIEKAIEERLTLEIDYAAEGYPPSHRTIRPLQVHVLRDRFYINAWCEKTESERTFRLDRILSFRLLNG